MTEPYHHAKQMRWSWAGIRILLLDVTHCMCFLTSAMDVVRESQRRLCSQGMFTIAGVRWRVLIVLGLGVQASFQGRGDGNGKAVD